MIAELSLALQAQRNPAAPAPRPGGWQRPHQPIFASLQQHPPPGPTLHHAGGLTIKSSVASCSASMPSTVQRNGSGATLLVISLAWWQQRGRGTAGRARVIGRVACQGSTHHPLGRAVPLQLNSIAKHSEHRNRPPTQLPLTSRAKGSLRISRLVLRWYLRISRSATVPGRKRCGFSAAGQAQAGEAECNQLRAHTTTLAARTVQPLQVAPQAQGRCRLWLGAGGSGGVRRSSHSLTAAAFTALAGDLPFLGRVLVAPRLDGLCRGGAERFEWQQAQPPSPAATRQS